MSKRTKRPEETTTAKLLPSLCTRAPASSARRQCARDVTYFSRWSAMPRGGGTTCRSACFGVHVGGGGRCTCGGDGGGSDGMGGRSPGGGRKVVISGETSLCFGRVFIASSVFAS